MYIYISGKITGDDNYLLKFRTAELKLQEKYGCKIFNPAKETKKEFIIPEEIAWHNLMFFCLDRLIECTHIYMLPDWRDSTGAVIEYLWAQKHNIKILGVDYESSGL